jgi:hypothetical protein
MEQNRLTSYLSIEKPLPCVGNIGRGFFYLNLWFENFVSYELI